MYKRKNERNVIECANFGFYSMEKLSNLKVHLKYIFIIKLKIL